MRGEMGAARHLHRARRQADDPGRRQRRPRRARALLAQSEIKAEQRETGYRMAGRQAAARSRGGMPAAPCRQVPRTGPGARVLQQRYGEGGERHVKHAAPQRPPRRAEQPEPQHQPLQAVVSQPGERPAVLQRKARGRGVERQRGERVVQADRTAQQPDEDGAGGQRDQLPLRRRISAARCSGGICSSSRYRPLPKTCDAAE